MTLKASQRQYLVKVGKMDGYWMTKTGGSLSASTSKVYDGGKLKPDVLASPPEAADVTVSRAYDHDRDAADLESLRDKVGRFRCTVSVTPTDQNLVARRGAVATYPDALLVGLTEPDVNAASGDAAVWELTFAIGHWK